LTVGTLTGATLLANQASGTPADDTASILLTEGFASAWRTTTQTSSTGNGSDVLNGSQVLLTMSGLASGVTATLSRIVIAGQAAPGVAVTAGGVFTSANTQVTASFTSTDLSLVESVAWNVVFTYTGTVTLPLTSSANTVTVTATMAPSSATAGLSSGVPTNTGGFPRFAAAATPAVTIANIGQATTNLLLPFAVKQAGYDTGIAIANTTKDPFLIGSATPAAGTVRFDLFPRSVTSGVGAAGTQATITTSATVKPGSNGGGLDASGQIPAGGMWSATLSEVMAAASPAVTGDFFGYVFIQTSFVDAHGIAYILQNGSVTGTVPLLVLPPTATTSRNITTQESLSF